MSQQESTTFRRATIIGPGLLGASIGMALYEKKITQQIHAYLRCEKKRKECENSQWCDRAFTELLPAIEDSDLILLCTTVEHIAELLPQVILSAKQGSLITDVGSLKEKICEIAETSVGIEHGMFIGSHPMTGSEKNGIDNASSRLFEGKECIITPSVESDNHRLNKLTAMWVSIGMNVTIMTPTLHDEIVASISHLPHLTSSSLMNAMTKNKEWLKLSGNGLKDSTRIASGNPEMWLQILQGNKKNLLKEIDSLKQELENFKMALQNDDFRQLISMLTNAKELRDGLNDI